MSRAREETIVEANFEGSSAVPSSDDAVVENRLHLVKGERPEEAFEEEENPIAYFREKAAKLQARVDEGNLSDKEKEVNKDLIRLDNILADNIERVDQIVFDIESDRAGNHIDELFNESIERGEFGYDEDEKRSEIEKNLHKIEERNKLIKNKQRMLEYLQLYSDEKLDTAEPKE